MIFLSLLLNVVITGTNAQADLLVNTDFFINERGSFQKKPTTYVSSHFSRYKYGKFDDRKIVGTGQYGQYDAKIEGPKNSFSIFESSYIVKDKSGNPNNLNHFEYINITTVENKRIVAFTSCGREVQKNLFSSNDQASCYSLNEEICDHLIKKINSNDKNTNLDLIGDFTRLKPILKTALEIKTDGDNYRILNSDTNLKFAKTRMDLAIKYADELGKGSLSTFNSKTDYKPTGKFAALAAQIEKPSPDFFSHLKRIIGTCNEMTQPLNEIRNTPGVKKIK